MVHYEKQVNVESFCEGIKILMSGTGPVDLQTMLAETGAGVKMASYWNGKFWLVLKPCLELYEK